MSFVPPPPPSSAPTPDAAGSDRIVPAYPDPTYESQLPPYARANYPFSGSHAGLGGGAQAPGQAPGQAPYGQAQYGHTAPGQAPAQQVYVPGPQSYPLSSGQYSPYGHVPQPEGSKAIAVTGFVLALVAFFLGFFPVVGLVLAITALGFSIAGAVKPHGRSLAVAGIIISVLPLIASITILIAISVFQS
ncbi:hypothetical protein [Microbacterium sp. YY-01]|uniref:hypothetical protein n=1 Tax=Microbacterium sp. YY-01 TaxID=3421634 RepID=UPI003D17F7D0